MDAHNTLPAVTYTPYSKGTGLDSVFRLYIFPFISTVLRGNVFFNHFPALPHRVSLRSGVRLLFFHCPSITLPMRGEVCLERAEGEAQRERAAPMFFLCVDLLHRLFCRKVLCCLLSRHLRTSLAYSCPCYGGKRSAPRRSEA